MRQVPRIVDVTFSVNSFFSHVTFPFEKVLDRYIHYHLEFQKSKLEQIQQQDKDLSLFRTEYDSHGSSLELFFLCKTGIS